MKEIIDLLIKEKAEYAELRHHKTIGFSFTMCNSILESSKYFEDSGIGIRVLKNGALAFASTNSIDLAKEIGLLALKTAKSNKKIKLSKEKIVKRNWKANYKILPTDVDSSLIIELLKDIDNSIKEINIKTNRLIVIEGSIEEKYYINSEGTEISSLVPRVGGYIVITAYDGECIQRTIQFGESGGWERIKEMNIIEKAKEETIALKRILNEGKLVTPGYYDVVIGSEIAGIIAHEGCGHPQEADRILGREAAQAGESYVKKNMIGRKIGSSLLNISDDPTIENSYGFYLYDDEGVEARKKKLIYEGRINEFLHNRETAYEFGINSNASARASSYSREPIIRMSNTFIEPGDYSFEELIEDIKNGIYIKSYEEWNIDDIRWNHRYVGLEAYLIENGELKYPIREPVIEATTELLFSSIDAIGKNLEFQAAICGKGEPDQGIEVWTGGPCLRLRNIFIKRRYEK
ncbi:MAG: TldD/PmbA family protein [Candidatus Verstraetearchaeota archaeon]|jgi:TldD protein|nr:TldD/PmbA family protein [Candidatus Verstraetearchaeota archaeon]